MTDHVGHYNCLFFFLMDKRKAAVDALINPPIPGIKELNGAYLPLEPALKDSIMKEMGPGFHPNAQQLQSAGLIYTHVRAEGVSQLLDSTRHLQSDLINLAITKKCFNNCIQYPRQSMSSSEGGCMQLCTERWFDAQNIIGQRLTDGLRAEELQVSLLLFWYLHSC